MRSLIPCADDYSKTRTLNLVLYNFAKYKINAAKLSRLTKYCVLDERGKFDVCFDVTFLR